MVLNFTYKLYELEYLSVNELVMGWMARVWFSAETRIFLLITIFRPGLKPTYPPFQRVPEALFLVVKWS